MWHFLLSILNGNKKCEGETVKNYVNLSQKKNHKTKFLFRLEVKEDEQSEHQQQYNNEIFYQLSNINLKRRK